VTDLERFFHRLVSNLAATDPARLRRPLPLDEITREILPYRANRRALQLDTSEDYELVLLRLCAGEGDLVRTEPGDARERFAEEVQSPNPDLHVLHSFEYVELLLRPEPLMRALEAGAGAGADHAPPRRPAEPAPGPELVLGSSQFGDIRDSDTAELPVVEALRRPDDDEVPGLHGPAEPDETSPDQAAPACVYCGGSLPVHRAVNFCPHCGQSQTQILCPACRSEVEPGWRHCVACGAAVGEG
jgi:hypothetical protein